MNKKQKKTYQEREIFNPRCRWKVTVHTTHDLTTKLEFIVENYRFVCALATDLHMKGVNTEITFKANPYDSSSKSAYSSVVQVSNLIVAAVREMRNELQNRYHKAMQFNITAETSPEQRRVVDWCIRSFAQVTTYQEQEQQDDDDE